MSFPSISGARTRFLLVGPILFLFAIGLYSYTLAPSVTFVDSGELAAVIATDGVSHPSGSPLYLLFGKIVNYIPIGRLIQRLNFFSAVCGALSVVFCAFVFRKFVELEDTAPAQSRKPQATDRKKRKEKMPRTTKPNLPQPLPLPVIISGAVAAGFAWMCNVGLWSTSTIAEVYALHALLISVVALLIATYSTRNSKNGDEGNTRLLTAAAFVFGLGISNYPPFAILAVAVVAVVLRKEGWSFIGRWKRNLIVIAAFAAGLVPYSLLPYRAVQDPLLNWGNPSNWENFWKHVSAQQYQIFLGKPRLNVLPKALQLWWSQWPAFLWLLQIPGIVWLFAKRRGAFWFTFILGAANLFYILSYDITDVSSAPSDFYVYLLPLSWAGSIWIGAAILLIVNMIASVRNRTALAILFGLLPIAAVPLNWSDSSHRNYTYAEDFAASILKSVAPNALILCPDWAFVSPSLYLQHAEMLRNDVIVLDGELLRRSWYFPYFQKRDPEFYELNRPNIEIFLRELSKYEQGRPFNPEVITEKYVTMLNGLLSSAVQNERPPYILLNLELKEADPDNVTRMEAALGRPPYVTSGVKPHLIGYGYRWIPETPAFRLVAGPAGGKLPDIKIPAREFPPDRHYDGVTLGIIRRYAEFWRWRGDYYRTSGNCADAVPAYKKSLNLNPELKEAQSGLSACPDR